MRRRWDAEIAVEFFVDVREAPREGADIMLHREGEADRMSGRRVRVLPDDQYLDGIEGTLKRTQNAIPRG